MIRLSSLCVLMNEDKYPVTDESAGYGTVTFLKGDFFHDEWIEKLPGGGKIKPINDYTVRPSSCVLKHLIDNNYLRKRAPNRADIFGRSCWAKHQTELLATQTGWESAVLNFPHTSMP